MTHATLKSSLAAEHTSLPFLETLRMVKTHRALLVWALFIFLILFLVSFLLLPFFTKMIEANVHFPIQEPSAEEGAVWVMGWSLMKSLFSLMLKTGSFLLTFSCAYPFVSPFYQTISGFSEDLFRERPVTIEELPDLEEIVLAIKDGAIATLIGFGVGVVALLVTFIPFLGPLLGFVLCGGAFFFLLFRFSPARYEWDLRHILSWLFDHPRDLVRIGLLPALTLTIPIITPFVVGMASPFFVMHLAASFTLSEARRTAHHPTDTGVTHPQ